MHDKYGPYKVRQVVTPKQVTYSIGLPKEIGAPLSGKKFLVEVTQDGLLFTPAPTTTAPATSFSPDSDAVSLAERFGDSSGQGA